MIISKIGRRGQITLPRMVRNWLNLKEGDRVAFARRGQGNEVILQPLTQTLLDLRGNIPVSGPQDFNAIREQVKETRTPRVGENEA